MQRRPDRPSWRAVAVALAVLAVTAVMASSHRLLAGERPVFEAVNDLPGWLVWPVRAVMVVGTTGGAAAAAAILVLATLWPNRAAAPERSRATGRATAAMRSLMVSLAVTVVAARVAFEVLKRVVGRNRPGQFVGQLHHLHARDHAGGLGFPSGHSTMAMALALTVSAWWPRWRWPLVALAVLVALGRLYVGVHLPLDIVGGMALGLVVSASATAVGRRLCPAPPGAGTDRTGVAH